MTKSFQRLERVLKLEAAQGYQNKSVVGGIRQFAIYWVEKARQEAASEGDLALVEQVAEVLMEYGRLPGKEARARAVANLLGSLQRRQDQLGNGRASVAPPAPEPVAPPPPPKPAPLPERPAPPDLVVEEQEAAVEPDPAGLAQPVTVVKGVGPKIAERLEKLGIQSIYDLLYCFPRRYDDYTLMKPVSRLQYGEQVTIIGTVWEVRARPARNNVSLVEAVINDGTGSVKATWFNQPWLARKLSAGQQVVISGKVEQFLGRPVFNSPSWEPLELEPLRTRRIVPVYPLTEGLTSRKMREIMKAGVSYWAPRVPDPLPAAVSERRQLLTLPEALQQVHFPDTQEQLHRARQRLAFDELFLLQLGMQSQRHRWRSGTAPVLASPASDRAAFLEALPYQLTGAQQRVVDEILADMAGDVPMNRLLQGDVGSGKTVVAALAMFVAAHAGSQGALMAPTEILAEQHYASLRQLLEPLGVAVALLAGSTPPAEKSEVYDLLRDGGVQAVIGTHALIQEGVTFQKLGLAIVDEQHRFGVEQRSALRRKGETGQIEELTPHLLVMSATPIPRSLALSLYGDLDLSIIDEMPPGRQEIRTRWLRSSERERAYNFIRRQVAEGRQAYVIFPLVEESDKIEAKAAVDEYEVLRQEVFPDLQVALVHGRLRSDEKEAAMRDFYEGRAQVLVATSVIEVGVDVPNSTVMVVEGANRFGLAQLHQFRGRVGRGEHQSYCVLIADDSTPEAEERLLALEQSNDGFVLAEKDLELRGPGEFFGRKQSGLPELRMASLLDMQMLEQARQEANAVLAADPQLQRPEHASLRGRVETFWSTASDVS